jgi:para-nitrobenzyl esterase
MRSWARAMAAAKQPAYVYSFSHVPPIKNSDYFRAYHASEIGYVFGNLDPARGYGEADKKLSDAISSYWVNFARTGDPNGDGLEVWPAYDTQHEPYMNLGDTPKSGQALLKRELDFTQKAMDARLATE